MITRMGGYRRYLPWVFGIFFSEPFNPLRTHVSHEFAMYRIASLPMPHAPFRFSSDFFGMSSTGSISGGVGE